MMTRTEWAIFRQRFAHAAGLPVLPPSTAPVKEAQAAVHAAAEAASPLLAAAALGALNEGEHRG